MCKRSGERLTFESHTLGRKVRGSNAAHPVSMRLAFRLKSHGETSNKNGHSCNNSRVIRGGRPADRRLPAEAVSRQASAGAAEGAERKLKARSNLK